MRSRVIAGICDSSKYIYFFYGQKSPFLCVFYLILRQFHIDELQSIYKNGVQPTYGNRYHFRFCQPIRLQCNAV